MIDFVERYDEMHYGLMLWQYSFEKDFASDWAEWLRDIDWHIHSGGKPTDKNAPEMPSPMDYVPRRPAQIVDISTASSIATQIGQMVDRMNKMTEDKTFSMTTVARLVEVMSADLTQAALEVITNDESLRDTLLDAVAGRWKLIQLSELAGKRPASGQREG
ncbi:hypothetical protein EHF33_20640 (plasmid) [Deinococcus psychrotolerans]|uniref:Uncharacterized protein n=1 Tax=Deinococcus psychrotolerans TaxID=2489213 RepID=A0A3G8YKX0_9DEIO|nr:hypothetical protein [Deinococcus psychrotolerans]AZI45320.1 hypothetical protein EHF33_20640 [Deinococcus psychrotolerans]